MSNHRMSTPEASKALGIPVHVITYWLGQIPYPAEQDDKGEWRLTPEAMAVLETVRDLKGENRSMETIRRHVKELQDQPPAPVPAAKRPMPGRTQVAVEAPAEAGHSEARREAAGAPAAPPREAAPPRPAPPKGARPAGAPPAGAGHPADGAAHPAEGTRPADPARPAEGARAASPARPNDAPRPAGPAPRKAGPAPDGRPAPAGGPPPAGSAPAGPSQGGSMQPAPAARPPAARPPAPAHGGAPMAMGGHDLASHVARAVTEAVRQETMLAQRYAHAAHQIGKLEAENEHLRSMLGAAQAKHGRELDEARCRIAELEAKPAPKPKAPWWAWLSIAVML